MLITFPRSRYYFVLSVPLPLSSVQLLSHVRLFATPWTAARQASLSITNFWSLQPTSVMPSNHLIAPPFHYPDSWFPGNPTIFQPQGFILTVSLARKALPPGSEDHTLTSFKYLLKGLLLFGSFCLINALVNLYFGIISNSPIITVFFILVFSTYTMLILHVLFSVSLP